MLGLKIVSRVTEAIFSKVQGSEGCKVSKAIDEGARSHMLSAELWLEAAVFDTDRYLQIDFLVRVSGSECLL